MADTTGKGSSDGISALSIEEALDMLLKQISNELPPELKNAFKLQTFEQNTGGLSNKIGMFGKSFSTIRRDLSSGQGLITGLFSGNSVTSKDLESIAAFNQALESGLPTGQAWQSTMRGCTTAAKEQAKQCLLNHGSLTELTKTLKGSTMAAKAGKLALSGLASVGGIALDWAIDKGIEAAVTAVDNYIHKLDYAKEDLAETQSQMSAVHKEMDGLTQEILKLEGKPFALLSEEDKKKLQDAKNQKEENRQELLKLEYAESKNKQDLKEAAEEKYANTFGSAKKRNEEKNGSKAPKPQYPNYLTGAPNAQDTGASSAANPNAGKIDSGYDALLKRINNYEKLYEQRAEAIKYGDQKLINECDEKLKEAAERLYEDRDFIQSIEADLSASGNDGPELNEAVFLKGKLDKALLEPGQNLVSYLDENILIEDKERLASLAESGSLTQESLSENFAGISSYLRENGYTIADLTSILKAYNEELTAPETSAIDTTSLQTLNSGLGQLRQIYEDVSDGGAFDWSALINSEGFQNIFSGFTEEYNSFLDTIANAPDNIDACKSAFDKLSTAYIHGSDAMRNLTPESQELTASILEQMGVVDANELVSARLAAQETFLAEKKENSAIASENLADATWREISAILSAGNASESAQSCLWQLAMSKLDLSKTTISTQNDVNAILAIARASGSAKEYLDNLRESLTALSGINASLAAPSNSYSIKRTKEQKYLNLPGGQYRPDTSTKTQKDAAQKKVDNLLSQLSPTIPINWPASSYPSAGASPSYPGAGASPSALPSTPEPQEPPFEKLFDWIEKRTESLKRKFDKWLAQAESALTNTTIRLYYKKAASSLRKELDSYRSAYDRYMAQANALGLDEAYASKVRDGSIDIETVRNKELAERIEQYQDYYEKAAKAADSFAEAAKKFYGLPMEKAAKKIELLKSQLDLLDKKLKNAVTYKNQNNLIKKQEKKDKATNASYKKAFSEARKNLSKAKKNLKKSSVLDSPDVSEKEKKKIKKAIKNGKEVNLSYFTEGSKAYNAAVKYNEALKAKKKASYDKAAAEAEFKTKRRESHKAKFDNIAKDYEGKIKLISYQMESLDNELELIEASGKTADQSYYETKKKLNADKLANYQEEKKKLENSLKKNKIKKNSDEWYDAKDKLQQLSSAISDCQKEAYSLDAEIRKLHFDELEKKLKSIDRIISEQDFLRDMTSNERMTDKETGQLTDAGYASMGLLAAKGEAIKQKINLADAELRELQRMLDSNSLHSDLLGITFHSQDELKKALQDTADSKRDFLKEQHQTNNQLADLQKEAHQAELNVIKDLIEKKKESLDAAKDLHDYQRTIQQKTFDIDSIKQQIAAYSGDSSEEGRAKLQKLQKELYEKQDDLKETEYDRFLSDQKELLDRLYEDYEEPLLSLMEDNNALLQEALAGLEGKSDIISGYLASIAEKLGYSMEFPELFNGDLQQNAADAAANAAKPNETVKPPSADAPPTPPSRPGASAGPSFLSPGKKHYGFLEEDTPVLQQGNKKVILSSKTGAEPFEHIKPSNNFERIFDRAPRTAISALTAHSAPMPTANAALSRSGSIEASYSFTIENCTSPEDLLYQMQRNPKIRNSLQALTIGQVTNAGRLSANSIH